MGRGECVGRYVVVEPLGAGAMGVVYAAYDPELDRRVALKLLRLRSGQSADDSRGDRMLREAQAMARLAHPNVIAVHDVGTYRGQVFLAMQLVDGQDLRSWLEETNPRWRRVVELFEEAGRGLAAAHGAGIVHRDFKPDNVLVGRGGRVRVTDFGLARAADAEVSEERDPLGSILERGQRILDSDLTQEGSLLGTPVYMAPELFLGSRADARSDQYSFCVALWEALYRQRPVVGERLPDLIYHATRGRIEEPESRRGVPQRIHRLLLRGLATDPAERFPSMEALLAELLRDPGRRWRSRGLWAATLLLVAFGALGLNELRLRRARFCEPPESLLAEAWGPARQAEIEDHIAGSELPYADATWIGVRSALDGYVARWRSTWVEACTATHLRGEQSESLLDRRMLCLDRLRGELDALSEVLVSADEEAMPKVVDAAHGLPPVALCDDREALMEAVPPPSGLEARKKLAEIEDRLADLRAHLAAGRYAESLERARELEGPVRELGYRPLLAHWYSLLARAEDRSGDRLSARRSWYEAVWEAEAGRDDRRKTEAEIALVRLLGFLTEFDEAELWSRLAGAGLERRQGDDRLLMALHNARGFLSGWEADFETARREHETALSLARAVLGPDDPRIPAIQVDLANVLASLGRNEEALAAHREALALRERILGPDHPELIKNLYALGSALEKQGRYEEALAANLRALAIARRSLPPGHLEVGAAANNTAVALNYLGRPDEALERLQEALRIFETSLGPDHLWVAHPLVNMGRSYLALGFPERAIPLQERALAIRTAHERDPVEIGEVKIDLARALWELGRERDRALRLAREAVAAYRAAGLASPDALAAERWLAEHSS